MHPQVGELVASPPTLGLQSPERFHEQHLGGGSKKILPQSGGRDGPLPEHVLKIETDRGGDGRVISAADLTCAVPDSRARLHRKLNHRCARFRREGAF